MRFYRWLLRLYPARFREEYGTPLEQQFRDEYRESSGRWARTALWLRALADLAASIPTEFARELRQDLAYAARVYRRRPMITMLALTALALAIGATTGVFSVLNALLIRSLPFRDPARLVEAAGYPMTALADRAAFHAWRAGSPYWSDVCAYQTAPMNLSGPGRAARAQVAETSANFFGMLGTAPEFGRAFRPDEDVPGKNQVAVIGYGLWQQMFGGGPRVLGATIHVNGAPLTIVGVAPPRFDFPARTAVWTPTVFDIERLPKSGVIWTHALGRLKSGLSLAQADQMLIAELRRSLPGALKGNPPRLVSLQDQLAGPIRQASLVLLAIVVFVLLIACANMAHLLLSRIIARGQELAVRAAMGASRARLTQQLITESVVLTLGAAAAGLAIAQWAARLASSVQPAQLSTQDYSILDWRVLGFAAAVALLTGVIFGVLPAWVMGRTQPMLDSVRTQGRTGGSGANRTRAILIAMQAACTLALAAGSLTMGRSFLKLLGTDLGFRTGHVATVSVSLMGTRNQADSQARQYYQDALRRLRAIPGVEEAGAADYLPLISQPLMLLPAKFDRDAAVSAVPVTITPHYFGSIGAPIVAGRDFTESDREGSEPVLIVNEEFARRAGITPLIGGKMIGRKILLPFVGAKPATVIGIVRTTRFNPAAASLAQVYLAAAQYPPAFATFVARVHGKPEHYLAICRDAVRQQDPQVPVFDALTLSRRLDDALAKPRFYTTAMLFFGGFALLLALLGIYGVAAYSISQRTHEIGVRMAIGASPAILRFALLRQSILPLAAGMLVGFAAAIELGQSLEHLIPGAQPVDAGTYGAAALLLAMAAALAVWSATARVLRVDPMRALRAE